MGFRLATLGADSGSLVQFSTCLKDGREVKGKRGDGLTLGPRQLQVLAAHGHESLATTAIVVGSMYIPDISGGVHDEMAKSARGHSTGRAGRIWKS